MENSGTAKRERRGELYTEKLHVAKPGPGVGVPVVRRICAGWGVLAWAPLSFRSDL
jgi:hypothetical protein